MRIADIDHRGRMQNGLIERPNLQLDRARVGAGLRQGNVPPAELWRSHIDRNALRSSDLDLQVTGFGLELEQATPGPFGFEPADAARAVAAGLRFRTIGVVNAHVGIAAEVARLIEHHHLIKVRLRLTRDRGHTLRTESERLSAAQIDDEDLVAETAHLLEGKARGHAPLYEQRPGKTMEGASASEKSRGQPDAEPKHCPYPAIWPHAAPTAPGGGCHAQT